MRRRQHIKSAVAVTSLIVIILIYIFVNIRHSSPNVLLNLMVNDGKEVSLLNLITKNKLTQKRTAKTHYDDEADISTFRENQELRPNSSKMKNYTVLFWDPLPSWLGTNDLISRCAYNACYVSTDRKDFDKSDAVMFYGPAHYSNFVPQKRNKQVWMFMSMESPVNLYNRFSHLNNMINWTWTFRRDSDIIGHYGIIKPIENALTFAILPKKKSIAWFVSNCVDRSRRVSYVDTMKTYKPVDVYGKCGSLKCKMESSTCRHILRSEYNFYLSFENSICRDYITEKSLSRIRDHVIPVVRGGSNYTLYLPPHSYINTASYQSIQGLSEEISKIESDKNMYSEFHRWRKFYANTEFKGIVDYENGWCKICKRLHFQEKYERLYGDFASWWRGSDEIGKMCWDVTDIR